jgi:hypothetical protein
MRFAMRRALLLLPLVVLGCAKTETPQSGSATQAAAVKLTEADVAGTWSGTAKLAGSDSVIAHWTEICAGGTCRGTSQENLKDTIPSTYNIMGDSVVGVSPQYTDPGMGNTPIVEHWTIHPANGQLTGTGYYTLASKPDSVVARFTFTGARKP